MLGKSTKGRTRIPQPSRLSQLRWEIHALQESLESKMEPNEARAKKKLMRLKKRLDREEKRAAMREARLRSFFRVPETNSGQKSDPTHAGR